MRAFAFFVAVFGLANGQHDPDNFATSPNGCVDVAKAGKAVNGQWWSDGHANGHIKFTKEGQTLEYWNNQINLMVEDNLNIAPSSVGEYCGVHQLSEIYHCDRMWYNGIETKLKSKFVRCQTREDNPNRRRLANTGSCWGSSYPRIISFINVPHHSWNFIEVLADPDAGCTDGDKPTYRSVDGEYSGEYVIKWQNNRWQCYYDNYFRASCSKASPQQCTASDWKSSRNHPNVLGTPIINKYRACQYMQTTFAFSFNSDMLYKGSRTGPVYEVSIDLTDRCTSDKPIFSTNAVRPGTTTRYWFFWSWRGSEGVWYLNYDYVRYDRSLYQCSKWYIKDCTLGTWTFTLGTLDVSDPPFVIAETATVSSANPLPPIHSDNNNNNNNDDGSWYQSYTVLGVLASTLFNFSLMTYQCMHKPNPKAKLELAF